MGIEEVFAVRYCLVFRFTTATIPCAGSIGAAEHDHAKQSHRRLGERWSVAKGLQAHRCSSRRVTDAKISQEIPRELTRLVQNEVHQTFFWKKNPAGLKCRSNSISHCSAILACGQGDEWTRALCSFASLGQLSLGQSLVCNNSAITACGKACLSPRLRILDPLSLVCSHVSLTLLCFSLPESLLHPKRCSGTQHRPYDTCIGQQISQASRSAGHGCRGRGRGG